VTQTIADAPRHGPLVPGDLLRGAALVSVVVGTVADGFIGFALFMLVLGGVMVPRALGAPTFLDVAYCGALLFGAWAAQLDWYVRVGWLDVAVHAGATALIAVIGYVAARRARLFPADLPRPGVWVVTACLGVSLAVLWEFGEWLGHTFLDERIQVGYDDTMGDLAAALAGSVLGALVLAVRLPARRR
jgi:hypothetical protein